MRKSSDFHYGELSETGVPIIRKSVKIEVVFAQFYNLSKMSWNLPEAVAARYLKSDNKSTYLALPFYSKFLPPQSTGF